MAPLPGFVHDDLGGTHARSAAVAPAWVDWVAAAQAAARRVDEVAPGHEERDVRARADLPAHRYNPPLDIRSRTVLEEIQLVRLERAKRLLVETPYAVSKVADIAGFGSTPYFIEFFQKRVGKTPRRYRYDLAG